MDHGVFFLNSNVRYDDITDGSSHTIFIGEKVPDAWDLHWLSGTKTTLRNTGVPIDWLTYRNGLPKPGGGTPPPPLSEMPALDESDPLDDASGQAIDQPAAPSVDAPAPIVAGTGAAATKPLPGHPAFVGGFGGEHPGGAIFAVGDGSIRFLSRNVAAKVLQALAHKSDGKLLTNDY
jgi:hypothetical protein